MEHYRREVGQQSVPAGVEVLAFDVGETLIDESRMWAGHAREVGASPFTLMAMLGSLIERDRDHREVWAALGAGRPTHPVLPAASDFYPDAVECLRAARDAGLRVGIAANQPSGVTARLAELGVEADFLVASHDIGVAKPAPEFFSAVARDAGVGPERIMYVGDRLDNDIRPARAAGMRTAFLRRGPWGLIQSRRHPVTADLVLDSLDELTGMLTGRRG